MQTCLSNRGRTLQVGRNMERSWTPAQSRGAPNSHWTAQALAGGVLATSGAGEQIPQLHAQSSVPQYYEVMGSSNF